MSYENPPAEAESAEDELRRLGLRDVRVLCLGGRAWLEAPAAQIATIAREPLRSEVVRVVRSAGFDEVGIGLEPR